MKYNKLGQTELVKQHSSSRYPISKLCRVTCHTESHGVTCHPTQVNTPHLNLSQTVWYSTYLPQGGLKAELTEVTGYTVRWFTHPRPAPIQELTQQCKAVSQTRYLSITNPLL